MKIALIGYARSGKDSVADIIGKMMPTVNIAFADALKESFHYMFKDISQVPKPRMQYEKYGQAMRDIDENVWINRVAEGVKVLDNHYPEISPIITDVRHLNEADWCKANGFILIYVQAWDDVRKKRSGGETEFHTVLPSEKGIWMMTPDYIIFNNDTYEDLVRETQKLIKRLMTGYESTGRPEVDEFPL